MAIVRSIPKEKMVSGRVVRTSEVVAISEDNYSTNGESLIIIKDIDFCKIKLNSVTTDHIRVKSLTNTLIMPDIGKIDGVYDEITLNTESCAEFYFVLGVWYITSSDGLKMS
jgi:hypothetical protein